MEARDYSSPETTGDSLKVDNAELRKRIAQLERQSSQPSQESPEESRLREKVAYLERRLGRELASATDHATKDLEALQKQIPGGASLSPRMTLCEFFERYYRPVVMEPRQARPRTIAEYRQSLQRWAIATGDPPLNEANPYDAATFLASLRAKGLSEATIDRYCRVLEAVFNCAGPRTHRRAAAGLIEWPLHFERRRSHAARAEDAFELAEVAQLIANGHAAEYPNLPGCDPAQYYERLITVLFNTGLRASEAFSAEYSHIRGPAPFGYELELSENAKSRKRRRVPLNEQAMQAVNQMRPVCECLGVAQIFPWPGNWETNKPNFYREWRRITACLPEQRRFGLHGLRRLHCNELARINPAACQLAMGHYSAKTTINHYTSRRLHRDAVQAFPQPKRETEQAN